jgi:hypothetical protein
MNEIIREQPGIHILTFEKVLMGKDGIKRKGKIQMFLEFKEF